MDEGLASSLKDLVHGPLTTPSASLYNGSRLSLDLYELPTLRPAPSNSVTLQGSGIVKARSGLPLQQSRTTNPSRRQLTLKALRKLALVVQYRIRSTTLAEGLYGAAEAGDPSRVKLLL